MRQLLSILPIFIFAIACNNAEVEKKKGCCDTLPPVTRNDFKKYYDQYKVDGCFILFDKKETQYTYYNEKETNIATTPASTFKIPNSLISIETGVIKDENEVLKWDGVKRRIEKWNADTDLKTAYKNSTVWFYQEMARRIGTERMKEWIGKIEYGNLNTTGAVDMFWLNDSLKISPRQQIDFLQKLENGSLPFANRTVNIVKNIMVAKDTVGFKLRAKTGWALGDGKQIGWYVGYAEANNNVYFFANRITTADTTNQDFGPARIAITYSIFKDLGIYK